MSGGSIVQAFSRPTGLVISGATLVSSDRFVEVQDQVGD